MEVYIYRIYRAHCIKALRVEEKGGAVTASWDFTIRDVADTDAPVRHGFVAVYPDYSMFATVFPEVLKMANLPSSETAESKATNVLHIGFSKGPDAYSTTSATSATILADNSAALHAMNVRAVNVFIVDPGNKVHYFNHPAFLSFQEDVISRNMRSTWPQLLELDRLVANHEVTRMPTLGRNSQLYLGLEKMADGVERRGDPPQVLFLRSISNNPMVASPAGAEKALLMAMDELDRAALDPRITSSASSRLFLNIIPEIDLESDVVVEKFQAIIEILISRYATRLLKLKVDEIEVKIRCKGGSGEEKGWIPIRLIASSFQGGWLSRTAYREYVDPITGQTEQYCSLIGGTKDICVLDPYPTSNVLQQKRAAARRIGTSYAHDFLGLLEVGLITDWTRYLESSNKGATMPSGLFSAQELLLSSDGSKLMPDSRFPGENKIGMLAWLCKMKTPQYPNGREVVIIANDVTVQSGSFGVHEDDFFYKASEYARQRGLPRIFISCNSGARIGLVEELKPKYAVKWKDVDNPTLGFEYLYLSESDFRSLPEGTVSASAVVDATTGERHYKLDAIIGQIHGIGVENLRGSGLIAGETSRAYDETFTLSYVTGRSVGIGAYLNRLGQRIIQMKHGPMILTGYSALNKLLGKEVYTSQNQLGGPQIMYPNGITHEVVSNDREGMGAVLDWLNYTPKTFNSVQVPVDHAEDPARPIEFVPTKAPYDPRHMLAGHTGPDGIFVSGFLDKGSFKEYLGGWGKSVVTGRGRLGGINVGVIAVETRLVEQRIPADPGNPESREALKPQAGQVWYPDSAYKTAQAIEDFNRGENLPLIIFANWRGFSGGTRDMYGEILKFGAMIVHALRKYKHPVFVYIPPNGELRGGAWVVLDPTINPSKMEMYADVESRGGILEPPGICEVKYRTTDQVATAHRLDPVLRELDKELSTAASDDEVERIKVEIIAREKVIGSSYLQVAHEFADLHDRSGRMKAKGVVRDELNWPSSRHYLYWRLRRRLLEDSFKEDLVGASGGAIDDTAAACRLAAAVGTDVSDEEAVQWLEANVAWQEEIIKSMRVETAAAAVGRLLEGLSDTDKASILSGL